MRAMPIEPQAPSQAQVRQQVREQVQQALQNAQIAVDAAKQGKGTAKTPTAPVAPVALPPIPVGGGRLVIDRQGDRTVVTSAALPPEVLPIVRMAQETALGLMGLIAAMVILGPFARMIARRFDRHTEIKAAGEHSHLLNQQMQTLQQSVDTMAVELERISESQRFQSKLLYDGKQASRGDA